MHAVALEVHELVHRDGAAFGDREVLGVPGVPSCVDHAVVADHPVGLADPVVHVGEKVLRARVDFVLFTVLVGEANGCRHGSAGVAVEADVVFELHEPLRERAVVMRQAAVDVLCRTVGALEDPRLDRPILEHRLEPDPEVDVLGDTYTDRPIAAAAHRRR